MTPADANCAFVRIRLRQRFPELARILNTIVRESVCGPGCLCTVPERPLDDSPSEDTGRQFPSLQRLVLGRLEASENHLATRTGD